MPRRSVDQADIDRAEKIAKGQSETEADRVDPGEADLNLPVASEREVQEPEAAPSGEPEVDLKVNKEAEESPTTKPLHSKREEIVARAKARREKEAEEAEPATERPERQEQRQERQEEQRPATRKLRVDRQDRELTEQEYETAAQMGLAVGNRLAELNQLLSQARALANQSQQRQSVDSDDPPTNLPEERRPTDRPAPTRAAPLSDEALDQIREKLVYGDNEEGRAALRDLAGRSLTIDDVFAELQAREARQQELLEVGQQFAQYHPSVSADKGLINLTTDQMHEDVLSELAGINLNDQQMQEARRDKEKAFEFHADLRKQGHPLTDPNVIADRAATIIEGRYQVIERPQPPATSVARVSLPLRTTQQESGGQQRQERMAEKEQMRQPRRAAMVQRSPGAPQPRSRSEVVAGMRKIRGYTTV